MFEYIINPYGESPILLLNKHIGYDEEDGYGVDGKQFAKEVFELDSFSPKLITVFVNSMGGSVKESYEIFNAILNSKSKTRTIISGFAFSSAGWCGLSADKVDMYDYSTWMCHLPYDPSDVSKKSDFLDSVCESVATIIANKSGKNGKEKLTIDAVKEMMRNKTFLTAEQMYEIGLIDNIIASSGKIKRVSNFEQIDAREHYKELQQVVNKYIEKQSDMPYKDILNRLNLAEGSNEQEAIAEIARRENAYNAINKERDELKEKLEAANKAKSDIEAEKLKIDSELKAAKETASNLEAENKKKEEELAKKDAELKDLQNKVEEADKKAKEEAENAAKEKATNLVNKYVELGKVKNEDAAINEWIDMAVENYGRTEIMLESLPTNYQAPRPVTTEEEINSDLKEGSFRWFAAQNRERREKELNKLSGLKTATITEQGQ